MRIYNPFKKIEQLEASLSYYKEELQKEREKHNGKHVTGIWCDTCTNCISNNTQHMMGSYTERFCMLDCPCDDIIKKD